MSREAGCTLSDWFGITITHMMFSDKPCVKRGYGTTCKPLGILSLVLRPEELLRDFFSVPKKSGLGYDHAAAHSASGSPHAIILKMDCEKMLALLAKNKMR